MVQAGYISSGVHLINRLVQSGFAMQLKSSQEAHTQATQPSLRELYILSEGAKSHVEGMYSNNCSMYGNTPCTVCIKCMYTTCIVQHARPAELNDQTFRQSHT